ncbi:MAG: YcjF family protein [Hyphomicrobiales bacterium]
MLSAKKAKKPKRGPKKVPPAPRVMEAPERQDIPFESAESKGALVPANHLPSARGLKWGVIFAAAVTALISLGVGLWFTQLIENLFARADWLGWMATGLMALAGLALLVVVLRELFALARLKKLKNMRLQAEQALGTGKGGKEAAHRVRSFYQGRQDMAWPLSRLKTHDNEVLDGPDWLKLTEKTLMAPLDEEAQRLIIKAAKRVSIVTAVNPAPALDVLFTGAQVLRLLRQIAGLYGGRPGSMETLRLARMVITHLSVTGGLAFSDSLIQHFVGHGLAGRLSAKLGEGTVNGIMTSRIGLAAMDLCRPMPYAALERPGLNEFLSELMGSFSSPDEKNSEKT